MVSLLTPGYSPKYLDYVEGLPLQRSTHRAVADGEKPNTLILCEHGDVYTAGTRTEASHRPVDSIPVIDVDRGGSITWHGPGQLVGYPIVTLPEAQNVVGFVRLLEASLIETLTRWGITGERVPGRSGVWVRGAGRSEYNKIAAIGLRVSRGVTMHGFALNCSNSLEPYEHITACGISDAGVTTASIESGQTISPRDAAPVVIAALTTALADSEITQVAAAHLDSPTEEVSP